MKYIQSIPIILVGIAMLLVIIFKPHFEPYQAYSIAGMIVSLIIFKAIGFSKILSSPWAMSILIFLSIIIFSISYF